MAYLEQSNWRNRPGALVAAIAIQGGIVLALASGLDIVRIVIEDPPLIGVNIKKQTPPPVDDAVPPDNKPAETIEYAPKPPIEVTPTGPVIVEIDQPPLEPPIDFIPEPRPTFTPSLDLDPVTARPSNDPTGWVTTNDYPARDIRQENQGITGFRVVVGTDGRVKSCEITASSGFASLDRAACRNVEQRARFNAAKDANGEKIVGTYSHKVLWQIPD